jgi:hypothetical protein
MTPELKRRIQFVLVIAIVVAGVRTAYLLYTRHAPGEAAQSGARPTAPPLNADYYVTPKKLHAYDVKSARDLTKQPVWVKDGYRYTYFPYNGHTVDFAHEAGLLLPLEKLELKDVVLIPAPDSARDRLPGGAILRGQKQVMAIFDRAGKSFAVPVGSELGGNYRIYADEMFYIQDPRELYKHWSADVWDAVNKHQVKPGMNELQADFAVGMGTPEPSNEADVKTVNYPNGGKPVRVTYRDGRAIDIQQSSG